jgi:hypothetical protein
MFVSVKFHERDARTYTYTCDFPVAFGDRVTVDTKDGPKVVKVWAVDVDEPAFACKPITGIAPPEPKPYAPDGEDMQ